MPAFRVDFRLASTSTQDATSNIHSGAMGLMQPADCQGMLLQLVLTDRVGALVL